MSDSRDQSLGKPLTGWRLRIYTIIFEADTRAGRLFDQWLIAVILSSVLLVVVDSVQHLSGAWSRAFSISGVAVYPGLYIGIRGAFGLCASPLALRTELLRSD